MKNTNTSIESRIEAVNKQLEAVRKFSAFSADDMTITPVKQYEGGTAMGYIDLKEPVVFTATNLPELKKLLDMVDTVTFAVIRGKEIVNADLEDFGDIIRLSVSLNA